MRVQDESFSGLKKKILINKSPATEINNLAKPGIIQYKLNKRNELIFVGYNSFCNSILGVDCKEYIGKTITEAFPTLEHTNLPELYKKVALTGESWGTEYIEYHDNNISGAYNVNVHQVESGKIIVLFQDITNQKSKEIADSEQLEFLESIYKGVHHLIFILDVAEKGSYKIVEANPAFQKAYF